MSQIPIKIYGVDNGSKKTPANYKLIYYLGNEFATPTDEEKRYSITTGGWVADKIPYTSGYSCFGTTNNVDTSNHTKCFVWWRDSGVRSGTEIKYGIIGAGTEWYQRSTTSLPIYVPNDATFIMSAEANIGTSIKGTIDNLTNVNSPIILECCYYWATNTFRTITKAETSLQLGSWVGGGTGYGTLSTYCIGFCNEDNLTPLSAYGSDIATILSNSATLFQDERAVKYIANKCTGDFMISAVQNATFMNQVNNSANGIIIQSDEDWARFITLQNI